MTKQKIMHHGERLKGLLEMYHLTLEEMAALTAKGSAKALGRSTVYGYTKKHTFDNKILHRVCRALNISIGFFLHQPDKEKVTIDAEMYNSAMNTLLILVKEEKDSDLKLKLNYVIGMLSKVE